MEIKVKGEQKAASIRTRTTTTGLKQEIGKAYGEIMMLLGKQGVQPAGAPFAIYYNMDMQDLDVEMGFPVASGFRAAGRVVQGTVPGGRTAVCVHKGPYDTLEKSYNALTAFIQAQKARPTGVCYEVYITDPQSTRPEDMQTEINFPLSD